MLCSPAFKDLGLWNLVRTAELKHWGTEAIWGGFGYQTVGSWKRDSGSRLLGLQQLAAGVPCRPVNGAEGSVVGNIGEAPLDLQLTVASPQVPTEGAASARAAHLADGGIVGCVQVDSRGIVGHEQVERSGIAAESAVAGG